MKKFLITIGSSALCAAFGAFLYSRLVPQAQPQPQVVEVPVPAKHVVMPGAPADFCDAAERSVDGVVHVMVRSGGEVRETHNDIFEFFFGPGFGRQYQQAPVRQGSGSGVIISADGYIVTNNHVIDGATTIEVSLNDKRTLTATLVGTDPTTDIALLKVEADGLHPIAFANSDAVRVGEWVLAVGNPLNLTGTVTAGIVSAKGRHTGVNTSSMAIESFIQTDAAVNPGNSGGALVNAAGDLIGINTAIVSPTGSFAGYSFAVPSNIVRKVADDLKAYGEVQRALLGVTVSEVTQADVDALKLPSLRGVVVKGVSDAGAAKAAGLKEGDVILGIDSDAVNTVAELLGKVAEHRPGEAVRVKFFRNGSERECTATLRNVRGTTEVVRGSDGTLLAAKLQPLTENEMRAAGVRYGLKVTELSDGKLKEAGIRKGFVITKANRVPMTSVSDFQQVVSEATDGLFIAGFYPDGQVCYYAVNLQD